MATLDQLDLPNEYFSLQKWLFNCIGLSLAPNLGLMYKTYSMCLLILLVSFPFLAFSDVFRGVLDFNDFVNNLLYGVGVSVAVTKQLVMLVKRSRLRKVMDTLEHGAFLSDFQYREDAETLKIKNCVDFTRKINNALLMRYYLPLGRPITFKRSTYEQNSIKVFCFFFDEECSGAELELSMSDTLYNLLCLCQKWIKYSFVGAVMGLYTIGFGVLATFVTKKNENDRLLPFGTMSILTENINYELVFAYQTVVLLAAVIVYVMVDVVYGGFILHICIQLRILQNFIKKMDKIGYTTMTQHKNLNTKMEEYSKVPWKYLQQMLKNAVLYHIAILKISKETEEVFNVQVLTETIGMSFCCCFLLYHASTFSVTDFYFQKDLAVLICGISTLFLMSYLGNEVIIQSQAIADACYEANFIGIDIRFQKALMLIMRRSQKPIAFTVGKFATLSLVTAVSCCRACYSYYMLLHHINE